MVVESFKILIMACAYCESLWTTGLFPEKSLWYQLNKLYTGAR